MDSQPKSVGLRVGGHLTLSLHSSNEPSELSQWPCHDDSTINVGIRISIINIIIVVVSGVRPIQSRVHGKACECTTCK